MKSIQNNDKHLIGGSTQGSEIVVRSKDNLTPSQDPLKINPGTNAAPELGTETIVNKGKQKLTKLKETQRDLLREFEKLDSDGFDYIKNKLVGTIRTLANTMKKKPQTSTTNRSRKREDDNSDAGGSDDDSDTDNGTGPSVDRSATRARTSTDENVIADTGDAGNAGDAGNRNNLEVDRSATSDRSSSAADSPSGTRHENPPGLTTSGLDRGQLNNSGIMGKVSHTSQMNNMDTRVQYNENDETTKNSTPYVGTPHNHSNELEICQKNFEKVMEFKNYITSDEENIQSYFEEITRSQEYNIDNIKTYIEVAKAELKKAIKNRDEVIEYAEQINNEIERIKEASDNGERVKGCETINRLYTSCSQSYSLYTQNIRVIINRIKKIREAKSSRDKLSAQASQASSRAQRNADSARSLSQAAQTYATRNHSAAANAANAESAYQIAVAASKQSIDFATSASKTGNSSQLSNFAERAEDSARTAEAALKSASISHTRAKTAAEAGTSSSQSLSGTSSISPQGFGLTNGFDTQSPQPNIIQGSYVKIKGTNSIDGRIGEVVSLNDKIQVNIFSYNDNEFKIYDMNNDNVELATNDEYLLELNNIIEKTLQILLNKKKEFIDLYEKYENYSGPKTEIQSFNEMMKSLAEKIDLLNTTEQNINFKKTQILNLPSNIKLKIETATKIILLIHEEIRNIYKEDLLKRGEDYMPEFSVKSATDVDASVLSATTSFEKEIKAPTIDGLNKVVGLVSSANQSLSDRLKKLSPDGQNGGSQASAVPQSENDPNYKKLAREDIEKSIEFTQKAENELNIELKAKYVSDAHFYMTRANLYVELAESSKSQDSVKLKIIDQSKESVKKALQIYSDIQIEKPSYDEKYLEELLKPSTSMNSQVNSQKFKIEGHTSNSGNSNPNKHSNITGTKTGPTTPQRSWLSRFSTKPKVKNTTYNSLHPRSNDNAPKPSRSSFFSRFSRKPIVNTVNTTYSSLHPRSNNIHNPNAPSTFAGPPELSVAPPTFTEPPELSVAPSSSWKFRNMFGSLNKSVNYKNRESIAKRKSIQKAAIKVKAKEENKLMKASANAAAAVNSEKMLTKNPKSPNDPPTFTTETPQLSVAPSTFTTETPQLSVAPSSSWKFRNMFGSLNKSVNYKNRESIAKSKSIKKAAIKVKAKEENKLMKASANAAAAKNAITARNTVQSSKPNKAMLGQERQTMKASANAAAAVNSEKMLTKNPKSPNAPNNQTRKTVNNPVNMFGLEVKLGARIKNPIPLGRVQPVEARKRELVKQEQVDNIDPPFSGIQTDRTSTIPNPTNATRLRLAQYTEDQSMSKSKKRMGPIKNMMF